MWFVGHVEMWFVGHVVTREDVRSICGVTLACDAGTARSIKVE